MKKSKVRSYFKNTKLNFMVPHQVVEKPKFLKLPHSAKWLYISLCKIANRYSDEEGWFWHGSKQLRQLTGLNPKTIVKAKKRLKKDEFIDTRRGYIEHSGKREYDYYRLNGFTFKSKK